MLDARACSGSVSLMDMPLGLDGHQPRGGRVGVGPRRRGVTAAVDADSTAGLAHAGCFALRCSQSSSGVTAGRLAEMASPDDWPRSRRCTHGPTYLSLIHISEP